MPDDYGKLYFMEYGIMKQQNKQISTLPIIHYRGYIALFYRLPAL